MNKQITEIKTVEELLAQRQHTALALEVPSAVYDAYTQYLRENITSLISHAITRMTNNLSEEDWRKIDADVEAAIKVRAADKNCLVNAGRYEAIAILKELIEI